MILITTGRIHIFFWGFHWFTSLWIIPLIEFCLRAATCVSIFEVLLCRTVLVAELGRDSVDLQFEILIREVPIRLQSPGQLWKTTPTYWSDSRRFQKTISSKYRLVEELWHLSHKFVTCYFILLLNSTKQEIVKKIQTRDKYIFDEALLLFSQWTHKATNENGK